MPTPTLPAFLRHAQAEESGILDAHRHTDGTLCVPALIRTAVALRRRVQTLEAEVNAGDVPEATRERLAILQARDIIHRRLLSGQVPGWDEAVARAHRRHPRSLRAKAMQRAAEDLGLWGT